MNSCWLSILIPVYNTEPYLRECLSSIDRQWQAGIEVVFLDDCSTDGSASLLALFEKSYPYVRVVQHKANSGLSQARNTLLGHACGEYIWFLDSDDYILPNAIQQMKLGLVGEPDMLMFDYHMVPDGIGLDNSETKASRYVSSFTSSKAGNLQNDRRKLFYGMYRSRRFQAWARVVKKSVWAVSPLFPVSKYFEDVYNTPRLAINVGTYRYLRISFVAYRSREQSIVRKPDMNKIRDFLGGPRDVLAEWQMAGVQLSSRDRFQYYKFCGVSYINAIKMLKQSGLDNKKNLQEARSMFMDNINRGLLGVVLLYLRYLDFPALYRLMRYLRLAL
ncbi:Glycosyltransferases involved in cell wall biogenesis [Alteromonadaceae bacterium Bs31]|nr:Glycosyltransferases involved in cell wall biogenesis [Alteromonadaceae bacterium Bs31]